MRIKMQAKAVEKNREKGGYYLHKPDLDSGTTENPQSIFWKKIYKRKHEILEGLQVTNKQNIHFVSA